MENFRFLLKDVTLEQRQVFPKVDPVLYKTPGIEANERQFYLHVPDVADFYSEDGQRVFVRCKEPLQKNAIELYLNGSILGSILHQRTILALHASSFQLEGRTVVICGKSGFGKSSLTYTLCSKFGAGFLTDDITPIKNGRIMQVSESLKLWKDSLDELGMESDKLKQVYPDMEKYYVKLQSSEETVLPDLILFGSIGGDEVTFREIHGAEKFEKTLLNQYWKELSTSMQGAREGLFDDLAQLCIAVPMYSFQRPEDSPLEETAENIVKFLQTF